MLSKSVIAAAVLSAAPALATQMNAYWGQTGDSTQRLKDFCDTTALDYVTLAFVNRAPKSVGDLPGTNFAAHCAGTEYTNSKLLSSCTFIREDITYCQARGKKVLLSIGGVFTAENPLTEIVAAATSTTTSDYSLPDNSTGEWFAEYLWGAFGPKTDSWTHERPFDYNDISVAVDGFDFDIEEKFADQGPYITCINKLRDLSSGHGKIISASPQCPVGDDNSYMQMRDILKGATFDKIWIQFYNNAQCQGDNFNLAAWIDWLSDTCNSEAELYIGLQAIPDNYKGSLSTGYVAPEDIVSLVSPFQNLANFGGLMLWDANYATTVDNTTTSNYLLSCASAIGKTVTTVTTTATTQSATSTSSSYVSTSSAVITTSSSAAVTTSSSESVVTSSSSSAAATTSSYAVETSSSSAIETTSSYAVETTSSSAAVTTSSTIETTSSSAIETSSSAIETSSSAVETTSSSAAVTTSSEAVSSASSSASSSSSIESSSSYIASSSSPSSESTSSTYSASASSSASVSSSIPATSDTASSSAAITSSASLSSSYSQSAPATTSASTSTDDDDSCDEETETETLPTATVSSSVYSTLIPTGYLSGSPSEYPSGSPSGSPAGPFGNSSVTSAVEYTTSTVYSTKVYTVTSCAPTVTNCPAKLGSVTTEVVAVYTTVCPVTATETGVASSAKPTEVATASDVEYTTSTVYSTKVYTVTSCAATVTDCPAKLGKVTTEVVAAYTTVCPVTAIETGVATAPNAPGSGSKAYSTAPAGGSSSVSSAVPAGGASKSYSAVAVSSFTTYLSAPIYPTGGKSNSTVAATGTVKLSSSSSAAAVTSSFALTTSKAAAVTTAPASAVTTAPVTAGAVKTVISFGAALAMVLALAM
ncbi:Glycoside hydrolase 18 protein [Neopestalotiopsis sp. 37M]|nr:Glycoside hydrolase 18 protein [Neopestalotiopsis sp. 37M]